MSNDLFDSYESPVKSKKLIDNWNLGVQEITCYKCRLCNKVLESKIEMEEHIKIPKKIIFPVGLVLGNEKTPLLGQKGITGYESFFQIFIDSYNKFHQNHEQIPQVVEIENGKISEIHPEYGSSASIVDWAKRNDFLLSEKRFNQFIKKYSSQVELIKEQYNLKELTRIIS